MTYCVAIKLNAGLVFLSDSRTNAGLDQISTFRKMIVYEKTDDRFMVLLSAGNLSISQSVREILQIEQLKDTPESEPITIWNARSMFDAARVLGSAIRRVHDRDAASLKQAGVDFNVSLIFGGQIQGEGTTQSSGIRTRADYESSKLLAEADAQATRILGEGEKEAAKSFEVFKQEPDLAIFLLKLKALDQFLQNRSTLILDANTAPLDLLKPQAPAGPARK